MDKREILLELRSSLQDSLESINKELKSQQFDIGSIIKQIKAGEFPPTKGYRITAEDFEKIARSVIRHVSEFGWNKCSDYINSWHSKVIIK